VRLSCLLVLLLCVALSGCGASQPGVRKVWLPAYAFGTLDGGDLDVRDVCPASHAEELAVGSSWSTFGISVATLGVYTPREARVKCAR
jgi:hypothetical protein